jgi:hypothetical protein
MGKERGVFTHSDDGKGTPFPPGSNGETVWKIACGKINAPQAFTVEAAAERTKRNAAQNTPLIRALVHVVALESVACRAVDQHRLRSRRLEAAADHCRARRPALVAYHAHHLARPR